MLGFRQNTTEDITACTETNVMTYMKNVHLLRSTKHCRSHGSVREHGIRLVELAIGRQEEAKEQEKEIGVPKEPRKENQTQERNLERRHLQIVRTGTLFANLDLNAQTRTMGDATSCM